jgi:Zn-dependent peptidase ImmA (M78 family)
MQNTFDEYDLDDEIINKIPCEEDRKFITDFVQKDGAKYLQDICNQYNINLCDAEKGTADGYIMYDANENIFEIYLNKNQSTPTTTRQRFTVAHELGHFFLHKEQIKKYGTLDRGPLCDITDKKERSEKVIMEKEANNFAAAILMPSRQFMEYFVVQKGNINEIANYFKVSLDATKIRAAKLGLIFDF